MGYCLRQTKTKKGTYLQMYETYWDKSKKQARTRHITSFGYAENLRSSEIPDPVSYYSEYVKQKEIERKRLFDDSRRPRISDETYEKYLGHFLIHSLMEMLDLKEIIDILASVHTYRFSLYEMIEALISSRIISPCSKSKTVSNVFPLLYGNYGSMSEDQVYDGCFFIGETYEKYIELFNMQYAKLYRRNFGKVYFDCTNYYFEIDVPSEDRQKGASKENHNSPIIGQALLLDSDLVPVAMKMYPGNKSEKPYIRKMIEDMKTKYKVTGRTVQIADKGLNCARNIYAAVKEADDGYIFSRSVRGHNLSEKEKLWVLAEDGYANKYTDHYDSAGVLRYRIKSCVDTFNYRFKETDPDTGEEVWTDFSVKEKRVVSYNPALAVKQKTEILKEAEKASSYITYKKMAREELGDAAKYITVTSKDSSGKSIKPIVQINRSKIEEDLKYAGYNLIVTSETKMSPEEIYEAYHGLWKIEESFRITKTFLDARPVYLQKKESIYGHFLICYLSLFLLRVLEIKCFDGKATANDIIRFARDFRVVKKDDETYLNISHDREIILKMKEITGLTNLDALILSEKEINNLFKKTIL